MIPLLELGALNAPMIHDIDRAILRVSHSGRYILGPEVEAFEAAWAHYCGTKYCVGTGNCLDALHIMLRGLGIGPGDEVIVPSNTYIATWLAVSLAGATPVPVEPDPMTYNLDPRGVLAAITPRTRAVLAVHLYGMPAEMDILRKLCRAKGLALLEDAAQAHGSRHNWVRTGALSDAAAFSFYPSKNLGGLGDAGAITTNDPSLARYARRARNYGGVGRLDHQMKGINSRMDEMQAAILRAKLPYLDWLNGRRQHRAAIYSENLKDVVGTPFLPLSCSEHNFHQYVIRTPMRDRLQATLATGGIDSHIHYPIPPHLEPAYSELGLSAGAFPIAERLANEVLSLPIGNDVDAFWIAHEVEAAICSLTTMSLRAR